MNPSRKLEPGSAEEARLHRLIQEEIEGPLSKSDSSELATLLAASERAREIYVSYSQLHTALGREEALREQLAAAMLPDNVVSLPGTRQVYPPAAGKGVSDAPPAHPPTRGVRSVKWGIGIAATLAGLGGVTFLMGHWGNRQESSEDASRHPSPLVAREAPTSEGSSQITKSGKKIKSVIKDQADGDLSPLEQYESSPVMAQVVPGSQSRPPANVVSVGAKTRVSFNRDIRPLLSDNCFHCHGPDEEGRKADLRLDLRQTAIASESNGDAPIVPGDLAGSEFFARLTAGDPDDLMPPPDSHKRLTPSQIALFRQWILEGAEWEEHWAFVPAEKKAPPVVDSDWIRNDIDRFVLARLQEERWEPSQQADPYTLVRRVTLDLTGLPPTPEEIEAFVSDPSSSAYEKLVDRLLDAPSYGEHRARYWLDGARYGDTHGLHLDNYREIWPYRNWVIDAYNENLPFDQFTIEQIAGDLLPEPTQDQLVATGFNRCNVTTSEGGAIEEEFLVRYAIDRVSTTSTVWMGLTAGCAQCHNHKYDPISQKEFYQLFAYFNHSTQPGMDGNAKDSPPVIRVFPDEETEAMVDRLKAETAKVESGQLAQIAKASQASFDQWLALDERGARLEEASLPGAILDGAAAATSDAPTNLGNIGNFRRDQPFTVAFSFQAPKEDGRSILLQKTDPDQHDRGWRVVLEDQAINLELIGSWPSETLRSGITRRVKAGSSGHFAVSYDGSGSSEGIRLYLRGQLQASRFVKEWYDTLREDFATDAPLRVGGLSPESGLTPRVEDVRLYDRQLSDREIKFLNERPRMVALANRPEEKRTPKEAGELRQAWLVALHAPYREVLVRKAELETRRRAIESKTPVTLVMNEKAEGEPMAQVLERGEYDKPVEEVSAGVPDFLPALAEGAPSNRLGLARWLVSGQHPLTARVTVNRAWQELFGTGLVKTAEDFGTQGEPPSHPELLDWLAIHFMESGWDVKALYRTLVMSATYQQSARTPQGHAMRDLENRLLARGPRFRLDAEVIRDQALAASDLLDRTVGGESVKPWQPGGIWEAVGYTNSNTQTFYPDFGARAEHRRSLYTFWKRTAPPPNLAVFDAPNRESCTVRRERTNTPLQALVLMNDPQFLRATRYLALGALNAHEAIDQRIDFMAMRLAGRPLDDEEKRVIKASLAKFQNAWESDQPAAREFLTDEVNDHFSLAQVKEPVELASWTMVASQILNLDESISKP